MSNESKGQQLAKVLDGQGTIAQKLNSAVVVAMIEARLRGGVTIADFQASALQAATDPKLKDCNTISLFMAIIKVAELGLLPGPTAKHVALIPRAGTIDVMPMFRGYLYLMRKIPGIASVECVLVHDADTMEYDHEARLVTRHDYPKNPFARVFCPPGKNGLADTGLSGGFCRFIFEDGTIRDLLCGGEHILKAMAVAQTKNVWNQWFELMALKTVANYASARLATFLDVDQGPLAYIEAVRDHDNNLSAEPQVEAPKALSDQRNGQVALGEKLRASRQAAAVTVAAEAPADDWSDTLDAMTEPASEPVANKNINKSNSELLQLVANLNNIDCDAVLYDLTADCNIAGCTSDRAFKALEGGAAAAAREWLLGQLEVR